MRPLLLAGTLLLLLGSMAQPGAAQQAGVRYTITLDCGASNASPFVPGTPATSAQGGCPIRATDGDDLMGDPSIAVDPLFPDDLIIASLHGQSSDADGDGQADGPSVKARTGQVFTTFTSQDQGQSWVDNPFVPPDDIGFAYGMHPQVAIDPYGQVYVGSLYAIPDGKDANGTNAFEYVIGAQKFENIDTIDEEQATSNGGYNAEYITPVYEGNQIDQMWFLFNPVKDNMTLVWRESVPVPPVPECLTDGSYLLNATGFYVKADPVAESAAVYRESNGVPDLQTPQTCPADPDQQVVASPSAPPKVAPAVASNAKVAPAPAPVAPAPVQSPPTRALSLQPSGGLASAAARAPAVPVLPTPASVQPPQNGSGNQTNSTSSSPSNSTSSSNSTGPSAPSSSKGATTRQVGAIGVVWTTSDSDTPYYYQPLDDVIEPCASSTNPVLSYGWLYVGCVVDTSQGTFRWAPEVRNGTVQLFRMDPDGGKPEYMGEAPGMVGLPKLGVRSDGRLALVAAGAKDGALQVSAAYGQYEPAQHRIQWSDTFAVGHDILPLDPEVLVQRADVQDMVYREQSGALHFILKYTVDIVGGPRDTLDRLGLAPHIQKMVVAIDERYGVLATIPLAIGDPTVRQGDATIATSPEAAFQDLSDDFLQLAPEPYKFQGKFLGDLYQREFIAVGDYGTVLFAEVIEDTDIQAPAFGAPPVPPAPITPSPATTNLVAPVVGVAGIGAVMGTLVLNRRKNPLAAFTKGE